MAGSAQTTVIPVTLRLSEQARAKLTERAATRGQDLSTVASDLIEQAIASKNIEELLAPYRRQVAESGMSDQELDELHRQMLEKVRRQKQAGSA